MRRDQDRALLLALPDLQDVAALIFCSTHCHLSSPTGGVQGSMLSALLLRGAGGLAAGASSFLWQQQCAIQACRRSRVLCIRLWAEGTEVVLLLRREP